MNKKFFVSLIQKALDNLAKFFIVLALLCGWVSKITLYGYGE